MYFIMIRLNINNYICNINNNPYTSHLATIKLSVDDIFQGPSYFNLNPCPDPNGFPNNILLSSCKYFLVNPIHRLFSHSLLKGVLPFQ